MNTGKFPLREVPTPADSSSCRTVVLHPPHTRVGGLVFLPVLLLIGQLRDPCVVRIAASQTQFQHPAAAVPDGIRQSQRRGRGPQIALIVQAGDIAEAAEIHQQGFVVHAGGEFDIAAVLDIPCGAPTHLNAAVRYDDDFHIRLVLKFLPADEQQQGSAYSLR